MNPLSLVDICALKICKSFDEEQFSNALSIVPAEMKDVLLDIHNFILFKKDFINIMNLVDNYETPSGTQLLSVWEHIEGILISIKIMKAEIGIIEYILTAIHGDIALITDEEVKKSFILSELKIKFEKYFCRTSCTIFSEESKNAHVITEKIFKIAKQTKINIVKYNGEEGSTIYSSKGNSRC